MSSTSLPRTATPALARRAVLAGLLCAALGACRSKPAPTSELEAQDPIAAYFAVRRALSAGDAAEAARAAGGLESTLDKIRDPHIASAVAKQLPLARSGDLERAREGFALLSMAIIAWAQTRDRHAGKWVVGYCGAARGGKGGFWLQDRGDLQSPYGAGETSGPAGCLETVEWPAVAARLAAAGWRNAPVGAMR